MHQLCIGCHAQVAQEYEMADFARCAFCHVAPAGNATAKELRKRHPEPAGKRLALPNY